MNNKTNDWFSEIAENSSLPAAYWLYGVVGNIAISILFTGLWRNTVPLGALLVWSVYNAYSLALIWITSARYQGRPIWRGMARAAVIIGTAMVSLVVLNILGQLAKRSLNLEPGKSVMGQLFG